MATPTDNGKVSFDPMRLSLREVDDLERVTGQRIQQIAQELTTGNASIRAIAAMVWLVERKTNPELTFEEVLDYDLERIQELEIVAGDVRPPAQPPE